MVTSFLRGREQSEKLIYGQTLTKEKIIAYLAGIHRDAFTADVSINCKITAVICIPFSSIAGGCFPAVSLILAALDPTLPWLVLLSSTEPGTLRGLVLLLELIL